MKTFYQPGNAITFTAPSGGVVGGTPVIIGTMIVIPAFSAAQDEEFEGVAGGIHILPKATGQAWTEGAALYWDDTNKNCTTTSSGNTAIGTAVKVAGQAMPATADTQGYVFLNNTPSISPY